MNTRILRGVVTGIVVTTLCVLALGIVRGDNTLKTFFDLRQSRAKLSATVADLESENLRLQEEINRIKSSSDYARKVLRDKYHVTEANERILFFAE